MLRRQILAKITAIFLPAWFANVQVGIESQGMAGYFSVAQESPTADNRSETISSPNELAKAPMLQIDFDRSIFDATVELTTSESAKERAAAEYALTEICKLDMRRSRESFLQMAEDESEDVRWRIAWGLKDQFEREDVQAVIAELLKDPSPLVRYMTILAVGPEKYLKELKALAKGTDPKVSAWASEKLKQLSEARKAK